MFSLTVLFISANFIKKVYTFWSTCISFVYRCIFLWKIPTTYMQVTQVFFLPQDDCLFCFNGFFFFSNFLCCFVRIEKNTLHHVLSCVVFMLNFFVASLILHLQCKATTCCMEELRIWLIADYMLSLSCQNMVEKLQGLGQEPDNKIQFGTPIRY